MKTLIKIFLALWLFISVMAEINYNRAVNSCSLTDFSDQSICDVMSLYGFDMFGDPFIEIGYFDKVEAILNN